MWRTSRVANRSPSYRFEGPDGFVGLLDLLMGVAS